MKTRPIMKNISKRFNLQTIWTKIFGCFEVSESQTRLETSAILLLSKKFPPAGNVTSQAQPYAEVYC